jgi:hypothetical protein
MKNWINKEFYKLISMTISFLIGVAGYYGFSGKIFNYTSHAKQDSADRILLDRILMTPAANLSKQAALFHIKVHNSQMTDNELKFEITKNGKEYFAKISNHSNKKIYFMYSVGDFIFNSSNYAIYFIEIYDKKLNKFIYYYDNPEHDGVPLPAPFNCGDELNFRDLFTPHDKGTYRFYIMYYDDKNLYDLIQKRWGQGRHEKLSAKEEKMLDLGNKVLASNTIIVD